MTCVLSTPRSADMDDDDDEQIQREIRTLRAEYSWVLRKEVHDVLHEVHSMLVEACKRFPVQICGGFDTIIKPDKFIMSSTNGSQLIKCVLTLMADSVCEVDLTLKIQKSNTAPVLTRLHPDTPWRLQQIQDAGNHLLVALSHADSVDLDHNFHSAQQVVHLLDAVLESLNRGRAALALPKKKKLEELVKNPQLRGFKPPLPSDCCLSFYVQAQKLVLSVYQLCVNSNHKVDIQTRHQLECSVPWLNEVLVLFTLALQQCQQLRDKISVFVQYEAETKFLSRTESCCLQTASHSNTNSNPHSNSTSHSDSHSDTSSTPVQNLDHTNSSNSTNDSSVTAGIPP